jgi:hypothetical protein
MCFRIARVGCSAGTRDQLGGGGQVQDVVVGKFLAVELAVELREPAVEGGGLVRVLAVAQRLDFGGIDGDLARQAGWLFAGRRGHGGMAEHLDEMRGDHRVVGRGAGKDAHGQGPPQFEGGVALGLHLVGDFRVIAGIHDDGDGLVVLGGAAEHGGAADVNVLDRLLEGDVGPGDGLLEGIEIDDDEIDGADAVLVGGGLVGGIVAQ